MSAHDTTPEPRNPFGTADVRRPKSTPAEIEGERAYNKLLMADAAKCELTFACFNAPHTPTTDGFVIDAAVTKRAEAHVTAYYSRRPTPVFVVESGGEAHHRLSVGATFMTVNSPHSPPSQLNAVCNQPHRITWQVVKALGIALDEKTKQRTMGRYYQPVRYEALSEIEYQQAIRDAGSRAMGSELAA